MSARSKHIGYDIEYDGSKWVFSDTKKSIEEKCSHRPCANCGCHTIKDGAGEYDGCIGKIKGVINACCGHGVESDAYVQFEDGSVIRGLEAIEYQKNNEESQV